MAEIAVSLLKVTLERLGSPIMEELWLFCCLHKDIENLRNTLSIIMGMLSDAEEKQQTNMGVKRWLKQLKEAAYDAADILDECQTEALRRELETEGGFTEKVREFFSASNPLVFDLLMAHKVKDIRERLSKIAEEGSHLGLRAGERSSEVASRQETDSYLSESDVKGREDDKGNIVELLLNKGNEEKFLIISVVGMGGLGKTTLARLVCKDERVVKQFHPRIWVCVSDDYDMPRLTKKIIESASEEKCDVDNLELLQGRLRKELTGKKFLLVLDDVWNKKPFDWERLKSYLQAGEMGSKILVTTRSQDDATIVGTHHRYPLSGLSEDDCNHLFLEQAFQKGEQKDPNLVKIGEDIVKKCGGVPLAVKALGGLMRSKRGEGEWISVRDSKAWKELPEKHDSIFPALRLSYNDLPSQLKPCFAYCSIFPQDHQIEVEELVQLWMAEGFIQPPEGNGLMEDTGRGYFKSLLQRSLFQDAEKDDDGFVVRCKMHDLIHDLAQRVSEEDARSIVTKDGEITIPDGCRHLSVEKPGFLQVSMTLMPSDRAKKLRTLLVGIDAHNISTHLPCLRALSLSRGGGGVLSKDTLNSISGWKQLRYLCLSLDGVTILSNSFSNLLNLQTLRLMNCSMLNELPRDMRKMVSLRHLQFCNPNGRNLPDRPSLTHMPAEMGELTSLQTLPVFVVGEDSGRNIRQLGNLKYLSGELEIQNLENVRDAANARQAQLSEKANIRSLRLSWSRSIAYAADMLEGLPPDRNLRCAQLSEKANIPCLGLSRSRSIADAAEMLEGLQPHRNLRCLRVENYGGERLPHWMGCRDLPNLVELSVGKWRGWEQVQLPGQFRSLKSLSVWGMDAVKCFGSDFSGDSAFPSLEEVTLRGMANLEEWSVCNGGRQGALPSLKRLTVWECPKLSAVPCFPLLSSLLLSGFKAESLPNCFFQNQLTHLSKLEIFRCQNLESLSWELGNVAATLQELIIGECRRLVSLFPEEMQNYSPCLRRLRIWSCDGLTSLRLQGLASLTSLEIGSCENLASFEGGMHHLTALQRLQFYHCDSLSGSLADGMEHLTSLTYLQIWGCYEVTHLPEGLKHATRLQSLHIQDLFSLSALPDWIWNLSSLQDLRIICCPVPSGSLADGMERLTSLTHHEIWGCDEMIHNREVLQHATRL